MPPLKKIVTYFYRRLVPSSSYQYVHKSCSTQSCSTLWIVLGFVILNLNLVFTKRNEIDITEYIKEPYIFPEIHDGNALQPTLDLLLSQRHYHEGMNKTFQRMSRKNKDGQYVGDIEALILNAKLIMDNDIETVQEYLTTGAPDDDTKREPWVPVSANSVINTWRMMREWLGKMRGQHMDREIDAMEKIVGLAIQELEVYEKYSDGLFEEAQKTTTEYVDESDSSWNEDFE